MEHAFDTERLRVFVGGIHPVANANGMFLYVAFPKQFREFKPLKPYVTALVYNQMDSAESDDYDPEYEPCSGVSWVETTSLCRRCGYAKELLYGLLSHFLNTHDEKRHLPRKLFLGSLGSPITPDGKALVAALDWPHKDPDEEHWSDMP